MSPQSSTSPLFEPLRVGELTLPNRIVMAPLTRCRAIDERTPNALMRDYYAQRASAGMILAEATSVTPQGVGYPHTPGIWSEAQVLAWRDVTRAVHQSGGRILLQLWHVGRISHPSYLGGDVPVSASAVKPSGTVSLLRPKVDFVAPRALETHEVSQVVADFRKAAQNAERAGFDGVEIHAANGYLFDQFLLDGVNHRNDRYGGSLVNRMRIHLEVTDACIEVWGAGRVGMHLSPHGDSNDVSDSNLATTFMQLVRELGARKLAFLCMRAQRRPEWIVPRLKEAFSGAVVANENFTPASAEQTIRCGEADAIAFGKLFISNPDLVTRFRSNAELAAWNQSTFYTHTADGYLDYPTLSG
jgi:2,4-dienoyl-CoA reductase-like NADH-dependent reductase (Old Yellow Enzyme family)